MQEYDGEKTVFSISNIGNIGQIYTKKKIQLEYFLIPFTETISKQVKKKKTKFKTWNNSTPKENIGNMLTEMDLCIIYLYVSLQARDTKANINRYDLIKLKAFLHSEGDHHQNEKVSSWMGEYFYKTYIQ